MSLSLYNVMNSKQSQRGIIMPSQTPVECPECGATAVEPCHKEPPKVDCVRKED